MQNLNFPDWSNITANIINVTLVTLPTYDSYPVSAALCQPLLLTVELNNMAPGPEVFVSVAPRSSNLTLNRLLWLQMSVQRQAGVVHDI